MAEADTVSAGVASGGTYEIIRERLTEQANSLESEVNLLNERREALFGQTVMEVASRIRVRTDNNCVPRDIVRVSGRLLFGYNVFIGLKKETSVSDVFATYELNETEAGFEISEQAECDFLSDSSFVSDFRDLYAYYQAAQLARMQVIDQKLFVTFQIGENIDDVRVFRWGINTDGSVQYIDDRGEREVPKPPAHDFTWRACGQDDLMSARRAPAYSIHDQIFVEISGGELKFKTEDNTPEGAVLTTEVLEEPNQTLNDAQIGYTQAGGLLLIRVRPYAESQTRYYTYDKLTHSIERHDEIGIAARALPDDHGVIFPGGYCLANASSRRFEDDVEGLRFSRQIPSPNGEDVLFVFYEPEAGRYGLYAYNLIRKTLQNPLYAHGYSLFKDGTLVIFQSENSEPNRNHPMQIWHTSFYSEDEAPSIAADNPLGKIGNNELVRGIADLLDIVQAARSSQVTIASYNALIQSCRRIKDNYFWLGDTDLGSFNVLIDDVAATSELVLDEFEKIAEIQAHANNALNSAEAEQTTLLREIETSDWHRAQDFVRALGALRKQRGHLLTIAELRYIDVNAVSALEKVCVAASEDLSKKTIGFLLKEDALDPYEQRLIDLNKALEHANSSADVKPVEASLDELSGELDLLTDLLGTLAVDDATKRTSILESISELFAKLNACKAQARNKVRSLGSGEAKAEFSAQFTLFSQSVTNALAQADTPERCDLELGRLTIAIEELEGKFGEFDEFLPDIINKREELRDAFDAHKQTLLDQQQRRAQNLVRAADRILESLTKRAARFSSIEELNTHFSTDTMVVKLKDTIENIRSLNDTVSADDLEGRLKAAQDNGLRSLRDKTDIFENDGAIIKLGKHRFSVNQQPLDLSIIPREEGLFAHLTGTGFAELIDHPTLNDFKEYWNQSLVSETPAVYRAEFLAAEIINETLSSSTFSMEQLQKTLLSSDDALDLVRTRATERYTEGYEKGVHDHDALRILQDIVPRIDELGLLKYSADSRASAILFWTKHKGSDEASKWVAQAMSCKELNKLYPGYAAYDDLVEELYNAIRKFMRDENIQLEMVGRNCARYLIEEISASNPQYTITQLGVDLAQKLKDDIKANNAEQRFKLALEQLDEHIGLKFKTLYQWLRATAATSKQQATRSIPEAAVFMLIADSDAFTIKTADPTLRVSPLLGQHRRISEGTIEIEVDEFLERLADHKERVAPAFVEFQQLRHEVAQTMRDSLRIDELQARPLSSFVRNKLLNEVYLPIIGDNLAKQLGAADDAKRTDLMGLLLLISPPGYGKTTLMEYVANRLGLIFVKVNGPALGHSVVSLDPEQAPNATAAQELEKLNLAFEMSNNVMLYVDDIQHTHPEFLQKFISLCDGTRRIEGVWKKEPKTYDLRGKRFCVVMAGNPYTESGDVFQVPDMLANRADVYNLGDVLSGSEEVFALSYIENSLTSNPVLAPLATRDMEDVYRFVTRASGGTVADADFSHSYSAAEANEIIAVLQKMMQVQKVVLAVNQEYIRSAATEAQFRTAPTFKLQGSYRNMNKLAEKVLSIMNDQELQALLDDHYAGESQLLTGEAEYNMLRLAQLRGSMTDAQEQRLDEILKDFRRTKSMGGNDADAGTKLAAQLVDISETLSKMQTNFAGDGVQEQIIKLTESIRNAEINVINQPSKVVEEAMVELAQTIETTFLPVVASMDKKIDLDLNILRRVDELSAGLESLQENARDPAQTRDQDGGT